MATNASQQSADIASEEAADSFRPIDYARIVLTPILLILTSGYLFRLGDAL